jgi:cytoskeletal protein CcmA (bactofilin family)
MKLPGRSGNLNGFLDAGSHLEGKLHFEDTFRVDGKITGTVESDGDLIVGLGGEVDGEILVGRLFVSGLVRGTVRTKRQVEITAKGRVLADLFTPSLVVEDGGHFEGRCFMERGDLSASAAGSSADRKSTDKKSERADARADA